MSLLVVDASHFWQDELWNHLARRHSIQPGQLWIVPAAFDHLQRHVRYVWELTIFITFDKCSFLCIECAAKDYNAAQEAIYQANFGSCQNGSADEAEMDQTVQENYRSCSFNTTTLRACSNRFKTGKDHLKLFPGKDTLFVLYFYFQPLSVRFSNAIFWLAEHKSHQICTPYYTQSYR